MNIQESLELFTQHKKSTVKKSTLKSYRRFLEQFQIRFSEFEITSISADDIGQFLEGYTEGQNRSTRHLRYTQLKTFFNYVIETRDLAMKNPCNAGVSSKTFKNVGNRPQMILDKETMDEIIFNSRNIRDRLIPELQARCGLRLGQVFQAVSYSLCPILSARHAQ